MNLSDWQTIKDMLDYGAYTEGDVKNILMSLAVNELDKNSPKQKAISIALEYGQTDGAHHKAWVIDQMIRALVGDDYSAIIAEACAGEDVPNTYEWDVGIAP